MNNNRTEFPKFYVGQKVVAIKNISSAWGEEILKKGQEMIITGVRKGCCNQVPFLVTVGIFPPNAGTTSHCKYCPAIETIYGEVPFGESCFAPIHENFKAITFEKIMEEELTSVN